MKFLVALFAFLSMVNSLDMFVIERAITDQVIFVNGNGQDVPGNGLVFANPVYDRSNTTKIGSDSGYCIRTIAAVAGAWECRVTIILTHGQISVEGPMYDAHDSVISITGGTGKFRGIYGEMNLIKLDQNGTVFGLNFRYNVLPSDL